jgi:DNA polymerase I-like protein with 3'-5' exonuclease and polymerase domains
MAGTATGRLSSSETIFGTGTNMQNLPKSFKKFLIADPGHVIVEVDKAQAEWVATAYVSGDARMIEACEKDLDAHVHTANLMFNIPKELIVAEHKVLETSTDEDYILEQRMKHVPELLSYKNILPNMSCRQAGKKSNHSFNYGLSPQGFAITYDMELKYARQCYALYHNAYPGLTLWHQHIRNKLGKDRTLENLFGRKRRFLNRWNDDLFKAAYSYIPQSTVGQLLNYGIVETYYQQDLPEFSFLRKWDLLNQVHDSMVFQYPIDDLEGLAKTIKQIQKNLDPKLYCNGREFVIKTDCKIGLNCKDLFDVNLYAEEENLIAQIQDVISTKLTKPIELSIDEEYEEEEGVDEESEPESEE